MQRLLPTRSPSDRNPDILMLSLLASTQSFVASRAGPSSALRMAAPAMQLAPGVAPIGERAPVDTSRMEGRAAPRPMGGMQDPILVQGGSLRTWSYRSPAVEQVQVMLSTEGRRSTPTSSSGTVRTARLARCRLR